jgi:hypothetical protein
VLETDSIGATADGSSVQARHNRASVDWAQWLDRFGAYSRSEITRSRRDEQVLHRLSKNCMESWHLERRLRDRFVAGSNSAWLLDQGAAVIMLTETWNRLPFRDIMDIYYYIWLRAGDNLAATSSHLGAERLLVTIDGRASVACHSQSRPISATDTSPVGELDCPSIMRNSFKVVNRIARLTNSLKLPSVTSIQLARICCSASLK